MVRVITQQTFDDVVKENIGYFDMTPEEAIEDAVKQFEAQGVNLSNIVRDLVLSGSKEDHIIVSSISKIKELLEADLVDKSELIEQLNVLKQGCEKDMAHKLMAGREGAYTQLLHCIKKCFGNKDTDFLNAALKALVSLTEGQPDLLNDEGVETITNLLDTQPDDEALVLTLRWICACCIMHEHNRQKIFDADIMAHLKKMLETHNNTKILKEVCGVMRCLVLDDDVRVEFGRAHDHAKHIATQTLDILTQLMSVYRTEETFISDILLTIASLIVRHEFCQTVEEAGGLKFVLDVMVEYHDKEKVNRQCFKLLKALAGNDDVKRNIIKQGAAPLICSVLDAHKSSEPLTVAGLGCIAAVALREVPNSQAFYDAGVPEVIVQCMNMHKDSLKVQKNACWAIRNMVARCTDQRAKYLELGIEELVNDALKTFGNQCGHDIKSALRDLGCNVKLEEQWTGKGGKLQTSETNGDSGCGN